MKTQALTFKSISSSTVIFLIFIALYFNAGAQKKPSKELTVRQTWLNQLDKIARPVMYNLANNELKTSMPVDFSPNVDNKDIRKQVSYLEAFGRTISGLAPWLQLEGGNAEEVKLRNTYREWALKGIANATNPLAKDYLKWDGNQSLVDASYLAIALIRAPWLWAHLSDVEKKQVETALKITRQTKPNYTNWILFSTAIEAFFAKYNLECDLVRIDLGLRAFTEHWYVGDGLYDDGMRFRLDYYNSIVIHPYLNEILDVMNEKKQYLTQKEELKAYSQRYAQILERSINTDGTYPAIGRSIVYRGGAFHHLADMARKKQLPVNLAPAQVREALTAVLEKTMESPSTFNKEGWLNIGLYGKQPALSEGYINTGSLYMCANIFLPLGLPESDEFWSSPAQPWTSVKIWTGQDVPADHALDPKH